VRIPIEIAANLPAPGSSLEECEKYTRWLATHHYENFSVATFMLPRDLRQHFYNVYAYCRWADDLADEVPDPNTALELLNWWDDELRNCYASGSMQPVFIALRKTIQRFEIPIEPFCDLLTAFRQDQTVHRYENWDGVLDYCRNSANPVGRLVLYLCGYRDAARQLLSDHTCTALQLANFWQDVSRDLDSDRIYIPLDLLTRHGLSESDLFGRRFDRRYAELLRELTQRTREMFELGLPLAETVDPRLRVDIEVFSRGGMAVLEAIEAAGYNTLSNRPTINGRMKLQLVARALSGQVIARFARR
jgi:squalene synthase HpnC